MWHLFSKRKRKAARPGTAARGKIVSILQDFADKRTTVFFKNQKIRQAYSIVLKVSAEGDYFLVDELVPNDQNKLAVKMELFSISTTYQGLTVSLDAEIKQVGQYEGSLCYQLALPRQILFNQRRSAVRISLGAISSRVALPSDARGIVRGNIVNLSVTGLQMHFTQNLEQHINPGAMLKNVHLRISGKLDLLCDLEIIYVSNKKGHDYSCSLGARFVNLSLKQQNELSRLLTALQRSANAIQHKSN